MDPFTLTYYAAVCGLLSLFAPRFGGFLPRLIVGIVVGLVAAGVLPALRNTL